MAQSADTWLDINYQGADRNVEFQVLLEAPKFATSNENNKLCCIKGRACDAIQGSCNY